MRIRPFILRCTALLLILVFSQKAGTGLFLHNLLHAGTSSSSEFPGKENKSSGEITFACSCIDDFLMPFVETEEPVCFQIFSKPVTPEIFYKAEIRFHTVAHSSLRGPPFAG